MEKQKTTKPGKKLGMPDWGYPFKSGVRVHGEELRLSSPERDETVSHSAGQPNNLSFKWG